MTHVSKIANISHSTPVF